MDKFGHVYTAHKINQLTTDLYTWSGMQSEKAIWMGTGVSLGFQTTLEVLDGFSTTWGFSWADMGANFLGTALYTVQQLSWQEERIIPKFSYHPTDFAHMRPEVLGSRFSESLLKDYNGQTYWLSTSPGTFLADGNFPNWLCFSFGYSAHGKLIGNESTFTNPTNGTIIHEQREFILSLDVDFSRIPVKKPWVKTVLKQLNYLKIPFPALILRDGTLIGAPLYF